MDTRSLAALLVVVLAATFALVVVGAVRAVQSVEGDDQRRGENGR